MKPLALANFDPQVIAEYGVTANDLRQVERYLRLLQGPDAPALADIAIGGYYGTAALLHEVVELRMLLKREPRLLHWSGSSVQSFLKLHEDAHLAALVAEYTYLQRQIGQVLSEQVEMGALLRANTSMRDFNMLAESDWPGRLLYPDAMAVDRARQLLDRLKRIES